MLELRSGPLVCQVEPRSAAVSRGGAASCGCKSRPCKTAFKATWSRCSPIRDFVAVASPSHVNNAMNLVTAGVDAAALGRSILQTGESMTHSMSIESEAAR